MKTTFRLIIQNYMNCKLVTRAQNFCMFYGIPLLLLIGSTSLKAQTNTNLGQNAGNAGSYNTSIGNGAGDKTNGLGNSFFGFHAGFSHLTGNDNTLLGNNAGSNLRTGNNNVFIGRQAGNTGSNSNDLTFIGTRAGYYNTGLYNTFVGFEAGLFNRGSNNNTFLGYKAGRNNTSAKNTFLGSRAGERNTNGRENAFIGSRAGERNTIGYSNVFLGSGAGRKNTTGGGNIFIGREAGANNIRGSANTFVGNGAGILNTGTLNVFLGASAGGKNTTGGSNTFIGGIAGANNIEGIFNSFIGHGAGRSNTTGHRNTFIGQDTGKINSTGSDNVYIGYNAGATRNISNTLYIANNSNTIPLIYGDFSTGRIGLGTITPGSHRLYVAGTAFATGLWLSSDKRFKKDRKKVEKAWDKINNLEGVTYTFKKSKNTSDLNLPKGMQYGLMAQELEKVIPELVQEDEKGYKAVNYIGLIPVLIEALKETNADKKSLEDRIETLESQLANILPSRTKTNKPEAVNTQEKIKLYQNTPNPFDQTTSIGYELPNGIANASIYIFDMQGTQKKVYKNLLGKQSITITSGELPAGMYMYSLIVNGKIIDTKKMLLGN